MRPHLLAFAACALGACGPSDPGWADRDPDRDGLSNADEAALGTDPDVADTDGDGYLDGDEVIEGSDPLDPRDGIYAGGWPYWRGKDGLIDPGFAGPLAVGQVYPRFAGVDQFGETVDLYDFAGPEQSWSWLVIDATATWCSACEAVSGWLAGGDDPLDLQTEFAPVRHAVRSGTLGWVTIVTENDRGEPPHAAAVRAWAEAHPAPEVPVLADATGDVFHAVVAPLGGWPAGVLVRADTMEIVAMDFIVPDLLDAVAAEL